MPVGWNDSRLASKRFQHRYGVSPRSYCDGTGQGWSALPKVLTQVLKVE